MNEQYYFLRLILTCKKTNCNVIYLLLLFFKIPRAITETERMASDELAPYHRLVLAYLFWCFQVAYSCINLPMNLPYTPSSNGLFSLACARRQSYFVSLFYSILCQQLGQRGPTIARSMTDLPSLTVPWTNQNQETSSENANM